MKTLFIAILALAWFSTAAHSEEEVIVASGHSEAIPFTWSKEKKILGMGVELCNKIFSGMGIQI